LLKISLAPSARLVQVLCAAHLSAACLIIISGVPIALSAAATAALGVSLGFYLRRMALLRSPQSVVAMEIGDDGKIAFQTRDGRWRAASLRQSCFVSPWLTIVNLNPENARWSRNVVIMPDSLREDEFRQLRVWLRWKA
jgi:toxin CptA